MRETILWVNSFFGEGHNREQPIAIRCKLLRVASEILGSVLDLFIVYNVVARYGRIRYWWCNRLDNTLCVCWIS